MGGLRKSKKKSISLQTRPVAVAAAQYLNLDSSKSHSPAPIPGSLNQKPKAIAVAPAFLLHLHLQLGRKLATLADQINQLPGSRKAIKLSIITNAEGAEINPIICTFTPPPPPTSPSPRRRDFGAGLTPFFGSGLGFDQSKEPFFFVPVKRGFTIGEGGYIANPS